MILHLCICFWNSQQRRQRRRKIINCNRDEEVLRCMLHEEGARQRRKQRKRLLQNEEGQRARKLATELLSVVNLQIWETKMKNTCFLDRIAARAKSHRSKRRVMRMNHQKTVLKVTQTLMTSLMVVRLVELALMARQLDTKRGVAAPGWPRGTLESSREQAVASEC